MERQQETISITTTDYAYYANINEYDELVAEFYRATDAETRWRILRRQEQLNDELAIQEATS